jgi:ATP-dependent DNA helicase RecQ
LVAETAKLIGKWSPSPAPSWVTSIPNRGGDAVADYAAKLADQLGLKYVDAVERVSDNAHQEEMHNSFQQASNVLDAFTISEVCPGPVLLVDDFIDTNWTMSVIGNLLLQQGSGEVIPFALGYRGTT